MNVRRASVRIEDDRVVMEITPGVPNPVQVPYEMTRYTAETLGLTLIEMAHRLKPLEDLPEAA